MLQNVKKAVQCAVESYCALQRALEGYYALQHAEEGIKSKKHIFKTWKIMQKLKEH